MTIFRKQGKLDTQVKNPWLILEEGKINWGGIPGYTRCRVEVEKEETIDEETVFQIMGGTVLYR